jgi:hypothetical protein
MVMLAAGVIIEKRSATCWQSAISAYYYTSAHSIVIAALLALGTLFIVYKGSTDTEDVLLTLAGVCTLIAAMVPQGRPSPLCGQADLPKEFEPAIVGREDPSTPHRRGYQLWYWGIALLMLGTLIFVVFLRLRHPSWLGEVWVLVIEAALILEFALYWLVQTAALWDTPDRRELLSQATRNQTKHGLKGLKSDLAQARTKPRGEKLWPFL